MDVGVVAIRGLGSNYYLAISKKGELYGAVSSGRFPLFPSAGPLKSASLTHRERLLNQATEPLDPLLQKQEPRLRQCELCSGLHSPTGNTILGFILPGSLWGEAAPGFIGVLSLFLSFSASFLTLKEPTLYDWSRTTDEMTHGRKDREAFCCTARNRTPMTSSARRDTGGRRRSITLQHRDVFIQRPSNEIFVSLYLQIKT